MVRLVACLSVLLGASVGEAAARMNEDQWAPEGATPYTLTKHVAAHASAPLLNQEQRRWLATKRRLVLATSAPDNPPFDIISGHEYQGLTAEYASLLSEALGLPIHVARYASRQEAVEALKRGDVDLLGSANGYEAASDSLSMSRPYAIDRPVLVTREDDAPRLKPEQPGLRLSMLYHYLPTDAVRAEYPEADVRSFGSASQALNAVAFGQADAYLGDTISTYFQLTRSQLPGLRMANFATYEPVGFGFAVRRDHRQLLALINQVLSAQPNAVEAAVYERWGAGSELLLSDRKLQLSEDEQQWLHRHSPLRVTVSDAAAPLSFFDKGGRLRGVTADLLDLIRLRTGLQFEVQRASGVGDLLNRLQDGRADLVAALSLSQYDDLALRTTRPYLESPYVLVTRSGDQQPISLDTLRGRRVAVTRHNPINRELMSAEPLLRLVETDSTYYSMALLASGAVDATVTTLIDANHALASNGDLVIRGTVGNAPAVFVMAAKDSAPELISLLDKALLSIAPAELEAINNRWRGYALHDERQWQAYKRLLAYIVLGIGLLLALALVWNAYLRGQIRQRRKAERALGDQLEFMRALLNGTPHPIYVRDREGRLKSCNDSYLEAVEASADDIVGKRLEDSAFGGDYAYTRQVQADYQQVMAAGTPLILDRPLRLKNKDLTIYHWILPYRDSLGEVQGIIGGWVDISDRRRLIQDLRLAKQQADDANRAKSTFLATISHEIRTPMNAVIGMLELALRRAEAGHLDKPAIDVAYHSAKDLLGLIGDILDIVRIESGHLSLSPEQVDLVEQVEAVRRVFEGQARQKGLALELQIAHGAHRHALLDPLRFKQVLSNLVSNAIKFTEHGHVRISAQVIEQDDGRPPRLVLEVRDSGIGIHEDDLKRLFNPFVQANPHSEGARAGTGLGLAISHTLCQMMGGELHLKSLQGVGTQVRWELPLQCVDAAPSPARQPDVQAPDRRLRVLVIDDHPANLLLMGQQLGYLGLEHTAARDGHEGLHTWRQGDFDVLILDCNMPRMSGYQLAEAVRSEEEDLGRRRCTIFGYTANAQPEVLQRCLDAGMDDCMLKPISLHHLGQRLATVVPAGAVARQRTAFGFEGLTAIAGDAQEDRRRMLDTLRLSLHEDYLTLMTLDPATQGETLTEQAHKVLSVARIQEARRLQLACEALEAPTLDVSERKRLRQALAREMRRMEKALVAQLS